jgi:ABC-2 type transport system permease protein
VLFTPLIAVLTIWVSIAISTRSSDVRVAMQLGAVAALPVLLVAYLITFSVIPTTLSLAIGIGVVLLVLDGLGWRLVSALFDRERLITSIR